MQIKSERWKNSGTSENLNCFSFSKVTSALLN